MTIKDDFPEHEPCVLVEGPQWGDTDFFLRWLLAARRANKIFEEAAKDLRFRKQVERLFVAYWPDFGHAGQAMFLQLHEHLSTFVLRLDSELGEPFAIMAAMGFFVVTGERYQMVVPKHLDMGRVKTALIRLAETEDSKCWLHPERLVTSMSFADAKAWQRRLGKMEDGDRNQEPAA